MNTRTISVSALARIEGEAGLRLRVRNDAVTGVELRVFEPPRFFEAFLRGRRFDEVPDIVARICGICPIAHQVTAILALERACGVEVDPAIARLRRLIYLGEWIESHALHIYLLHAPDFLGTQDAIQLAATHLPVVERALRLKKTGNEIMRVIGGREIHPINLKVGGFYRLPTRTDLAHLSEELKWAREAAIETVRFAASLPTMDFELDYNCVSIREHDKYPLVDGRVISTSGLDIGPSEYEEHFEEEHVAHSNALQSTTKSALPYMVGPIARFNLNADRLLPAAQAAASEVGLTAPCRNPFTSIVVRSVELVHACEEALQMVDAYEKPAAPSVPVTPRAGRAGAWTEAPRGLLYHRYSIDARGLVLDAKIVPPSAQNQRVMERDLGRFAAAHLDLPEDQLTLRCEQAIRNYDPCISCATHFLKLAVVREP
jgi:coenzyme F420-reducing hydrogenase alpha subunit